jgi:hypothetical protein
MKKISLEKLVIDINTEFHLLRHFESPKDDYISRILNAGFSIQQIEEEKQIPGSKFSKLFAQDIFELLELIKYKQVSYKSNFGSSIYLNYLFSPTELVSGVGTNAIVKKKSLLNIQKSKIYRLTSRGFPIQFLKVDKLPLCWNFSIVLKNLEKKFKFITAFPGDPGLPVPFEDMEKEIKQESIKFWNDHIILVKTQSEQNKLFHK